MNEARLAGHRLELYLERATQPCVVEAVLVPEAGMDVSWERDQAPGIHVEATSSAWPLASSATRC